MSELKKTRMREGFEEQRKVGMNVDWFTWQIAWHDALFTELDIAGASQAARQPAAAALGGDGELPITADEFLRADAKPAAATGQEPISMAEAGEPVATLVISPNGDCSIHMPWTPDVQFGDGVTIWPLGLIGEQPAPMNRLESAAWAAAAKAGVDGEQFIAMLVDGGLGDLLSTTYPDREPKALTDGELDAIWANIDARGSTMFEPHQWQREMRLRFARAVLRASDRGNATASEGE